MGSGSLRSSGLPGVRVRKSPTVMVGAAGRMGSSGIMFVEGFAAEVGGDIDVSDAGGVGGFEGGVESDLGVGGNGDMVEGLGGLIVGEEENGAADHRRDACATYGHCAAYFDDGVALGGGVVEDGEREVARIAGGEEAGEAALDHDG